MYHTCFICHVSIHVSKVLHVLRRSCTKYVWLLKSVQSSRVGSITTYQNNSEHLSNSLDECSDSDCTSLNFNLCCSPSISSGKWWYPWDGWPLNNQPHTKPFKKKKVCILLGIWVYLPASVCLLRSNPTWLGRIRKGRSSPYPTPTSTIHRAVWWWPSTKP